MSLIMTLGNTHSVKWEKKCTKDVQNTGCASPLRVTWLIQINQSVLWNRPLGTERSTNGTLLLDVLIKIAGVQFKEWERWTFVEVMESYDVGLLSKMRYSQSNLPGMTDRHSVAIRLRNSSHPSQKWMLFIDGADEEVQRAQLRLTNQKVIRNVSIICPDVRGSVFHGKLSGVYSVINIYLWQIFEQTDNHKTSYYLTY